MASIPQKRAIGVRHSGSATVFMMEGTLGADRGPVSVEDQ